MKGFVLIALLMCSAAPAQDAQPEKPRPRLAVTQQSWLGMEVAKPGPDIAAQLPMPGGIGFVVRKVHDGGPAHAAGVREHDVLEKLGDQMLVNEAQLVTLLRLLKPGDEAVFSGYRAGAAIKHRIQVNERPANAPVIGPELSGRSISAENASRRAASVTHADGSAEVSRVPGGYRVVILDAKKESVFDKTLTPESDFMEVPAPWRVRVTALRRGLDELQSAPRQPRPRLVPQQKQEPPEKPAGPLSASGLMPR